MIVTEFAPAKINLALHVTGRREDGYHLLDSLVAFCSVGDQVTVSDAGVEAFTITGPFAEGLPTGPDNLVLRAAAALGAAGLHITLEKNLPAASGIGGGSSDAAATLRAVARLTGEPLPEAPDVLALGADVPACLTAQPARMQGVGEVLVPVPTLPTAWLVLVNPGVAIPTAAVFRGLQRFDNPPMPPVLPVWRNAADLSRWLDAQRNDLQQTAIAMAPVIADVLARLVLQPGCLLARMSGSGSTCFGLFANEAGAQRAVGTLGGKHPDWWIVSARLLS